MRAMWNATRVQREGTLFHAAAAAELAANVIKHFIRFDIRVRVRDFDRFRMRIQHARGKGANHEAVRLERLVNGRRLVDRAGDGFEIVGVKREGIDEAVPANYIEWMMGQRVAR